MYLAKLTANIFVIGQVHLRGPMYGTFSAKRRHVLRKPGLMIPFNAFCSNGEIR